jgi:hypothetical protein
MKIEEIEILEYNKDILEFKGRDFKNISLDEWFYFCKANLTFGEPGIDYYELAALHQACETLGKRPLIILETGMCFGTTTRYFLIRTIKYGGELHTFEVHIRDKFKETMQELGLWDKINLHGHSIKDTWNKDIDVLFIDSEHALADALGEYMRFREWLKGDSIIGFHDTNCCIGVKKALEMIQEVDELELICEVDNNASAGIKLFRRKIKNRTDRLWNINRRE